ncbi:MAG: D-sedoheptulose 7-phosphate isomerase [Dehalococcoidia bacterium]|nr:D-sedoheptulose 7-phosphate isomerase [Dehalococcoidia bacterium]
MIEEITTELRESARLKEWLADNLSGTIAAAAAAMIAACKAGGKIAFCGNGGSAADSQHLASELVGRYKIDRPAISALALTTDSSLLTAVANDYGFEQIFRRQVEAILGPRDVLIALSTSGNSPNVNLAVEAAKKKGALTIGFIGRDGGQLASLVDISLVVPHSDSCHIQECHITIGHIICGLIERELSSPQNSPSMASQGER